MRHIRTNGVHAANIEEKKFCKCKCISEIISKDLLELLEIYYERCTVGSIPEKQEATHKVSNVGVPPPASAARAQLLDENATALMNPVSSRKQ